MNNFTSRIMWRLPLANSKTSRTIGMVTRINDDTARLTVTSGIVENNRLTTDGSFVLRIMNPGDSFPFVFDKVGGYTYYCTINLWIIGRVTSN
ncbi:MAG: hypothetical protein M3114_07270 [Thermoproteota archaeon]|nr:hypothetical protein [Thermoproteota archaeon]